ncbi:MBL fold metallo-hydrolase [Mucilaginibacter hurinus]|uniref:MBL fold metallo-hydrolase n=1 Tax=Mucilaginibacter hurinus TaxID=2201324 RepID=A0A367GMZ0_9SPHI|nr:MBL fold metallo-hydrolase [Mucilaginibacter hurinus]RCH54398.1 MBL fold metallo-hydrolase [Mucilaginibacter hurinus]
MSIQQAKKAGKKYLNTIPTDAAGFDRLGPILKEYLLNKAENRPKKTIGPFKTDLAVYQMPPVSNLRITWVGHSSLLIEIDGKRILTDPVWSDRVSFSQSIGPKRFFKPPLALHQLPALDAIIQSHDHYDHLDEGTVKYFAHAGVPFYCSEGVGKHLRKWGIKASLITELNWGDAAVIGGEIKITATPARHFSGRSMFNRNETLWSSWVIEGPRHSVFFGADSGPSPDFKVIGEQFGPFDLTMLEVGAYGRYWPDIHMGPANAADAHIALKGKMMMPIHWGTFNLAPHAWFEPAEKLLNIADDKSIALFMPEPGKPTEADSPYNSLWWKKYLSG